MANKDEGKKVPLIDLEGKKVGEVELPAVFFEPTRPDLIKRVFLAIQTLNRQPYGSFKDAGTRPSAKISRRRRNYRGAYGYGISRVPRKILTRRGTQFYWQGAFAPGTVGGRRAHPPKALKNNIKKVNKKEKRKALRSALSACFNKNLVLNKNKIPENYPFIIVDDFENLKKTRDVKNALIKFGFKDESQRLKQKKIRPGRGKLRGRRYKKKSGALIIVSKESEVERAVRNLGFEAVTVKRLNTKLLAPGATPGRAVIITKSAVDKIKNENLFM